MCHKYRTNFSASDQLPFTLKLKYGFLKLYFTFVIYRNKYNIFYIGICALHLIN